MKRVSRFFPIFTVALGLICGFLRLQLFEQVDSQGLLPAQHSAQLLLLVLPALFVLFLLAAIFVHGSRPFSALIRFPVQALGFAAAAVGILLLPVLWDSTLSPVFYIVPAACFGAIAVFRGIGRKLPLTIPAVLTVALLLLGFVHNRSWNASSQLQQYLFPALMLLLPGMYTLQLLRLECGQPAHRAYFFCNQLLLFCCLVCLFSPLLPYCLCMSLWLLSGLFATHCRVRLPKTVCQCIDALEAAGYSAYAVGGCVRDGLLGIPAKDHDLCTNATPEQICQVFSQLPLVRNGEKHGTIGVVIHRQVYEITTYRTDGTYSDSRHPDGVTFVDRLEEDLARRDFTVNAIAYHPKKGCIDPYGGQKDLHNGLLRAVGDPTLRFTQDALRILRGVRFACRFRLQIEPRTRTAMDTLAVRMGQLSEERVLSELTQILCVMEKGDLAEYKNLLMYLLPELCDCDGADQCNPHHIHDVLTHLDSTVAAAEPIPALRWAALLHDIGKPQVFTRDARGVGHFPGHAQESARLAEQILTRLKASNALREQVVFLVLHHMDTIPCQKDALRKKLSKYGMEHLALLLRLQLADRLATNKKQDAAIQDFESKQKLLHRLEQEEGRLQLKDLAIDGHDLMALGYPADPSLGACQKALLEQVLSGQLPNERDALLAQAKEMLEKSKEETV